MYNDLFDAIGPDGRRRDLYNDQAPTKRPHTRIENVINFHVSAPEEHPGKIRVRATGHGKYTDVFFTDQQARRMVTEMCKRLLGEHDGS